MYHVTLTLIVDAPSIAAALQRVHDRIESTNDREDRDGLRIRTVNKIILKRK